jgi:hypothetical protein
VLKLETIRGGVKLRFFVLLFCWVLMAHWIACIWWAIGKYEYLLANQRYLDGLPARNETTWLVRIPPTGKAPDFSKDAFDTCVDNCLANSLCNRGANCSVVSCMASTQCDDNNFDPELLLFFPDDQSIQGEVWNQWLSSFYWALTMLMKMPNVGPDTTLEKGFSCLTVILGAIFFALLLGQVTTLIMTLIKSGAQLRDQLVTMTTFSSSRRVPSKLHGTLQKHLRAEWAVTKGMDTQTLLQDFPTQMKGDVLSAVFAQQVDCNPNFLRCSAQLRRQILGLLKPSVALKKQTIIAGRQFGATVYILMKGALQVSQAPSGEDAAKGGAQESPAAGRRGMSMGAKDMKKQLTRMNTKGFKDKLKVRMLEKPGACIPLDTIYEGARTSPFSVFAVAQSQLLLMEAPELARLLDGYPVEDASIVTAALDAEFKGLQESLKMNRDPGQASARENRLEAKKDDAPISLADKVTKMEEHAKELTLAVDRLTSQTSKVPRVWQALAARAGVDPDLGSPAKKKEDGSVAGFFGLAGRSENEPDRPEAAASAS